MTTPKIYLPHLHVGKRRIDVFPFWMGLLGLGLLLGAIGGYQVLRYGLQVTGLSNQVPWGLWISIDLSSIALGGGAFTMGVIVYLLRIKRFENIGKLAVLIGFLGYSAAGLILLFDLGQPLRFWHPVVFWQPHSLLWKITMYVILYLTVLLLELIPSVIEHPFFARFPFLSKLAHALHSYGPVLAVIGLTLSLLHQASLGATYGVLSGRGLWFRPTAPVMFVLTAISGGMALLFVASTFVFRVMRPGVVKDEVLMDVARIAGGVALLAVYLKLWDWAVSYYHSFDNLVNQQVTLLDTVAPYSISFWLFEVLLGALIPGFVLIRLRRGSNLSGLIATITYDPYTPTVKINSYIPTWQEWFVGIGVISYWLAGFSLAARFLPFQNMGEPPKAH